MSEILSNIHKVDDTIPNNVYIIVTDDTLTLIDTGLPMNTKRILAYINKIGRLPTDVKKIILTHYHMDHSGCIAELKEVTGAAVFIHANDAPYIEGRMAFFKPKLNLSTFLIRILSSFMKFKPVKVDCLLKENDIINFLGGLRIIHTPGHTPGSISLYQPERKILFSGDTLQYSKGRVHRSMPVFSTDPTAEGKSVEKLIKFDFDTLLPGDGEFLLSGAREKIQKFITTL